MGTRIPEASYALVRTRDLWRCFRCGCPADPGEWHHRRGRSVVDEHRHEACNGLNLCSTCHAWVHANPFEARAKGWIVSRHANPCDVSALAHYGWVLLDHDGGYRVAADHG